MGTASLHMKVQLRFPAGQERLTLENDSTLGAFIDTVAEKASIPAQHVQISFGYPPKSLMAANPDSLISDHFGNGECITVNECPEDPTLARSAPEAPAAAPVSSRPAAPTTSPAPCSAGTVVRRVVDADNSCLFSSVAYTLLRDRSAGLKLREVVANEIMSRPDDYNEAVLEKPPAVYCEWIRGSDHWGGAIELSVLSDHFSTMICAWNIQSVRPDRFGEGKGYKQCVHLVYDGLHYDALALSPLEEADMAAESQMEEFDITVFHPDDEFVAGRAQAVVTKCHQDKKFTDLNNFSLRCLVCQQGLVGEKDAREHASQTGHQNFAEY